MSELETLPRDVSRLAYTQRILEIVGNIRKQKEEITKVHRCGCGGLGQTGRHARGAGACSTATWGPHTLRKAELSGHAPTRNPPTQPPPATADAVTRAPVWV